MNLIRKTLVGLVVLALSAAGSYGEVIRLQSKVSIGNRQDVRLGDIATISGGTPQQDEELAGMIILSGVQRTQKVKAESVLMAVMSQRGGGSLANLQISGAAECEIIFASPSTPAPAGPPAPTAAAPEVTSAPKVTTAASQPAPAAAAKASGTLRETIIATLQKEIALPEGDYQITIESSNLALDKPVETGRQWICRPTTRTILGTVQMESQLVEGSKLIQRTNISTTVLRKQMVVMVTKKFGRGDIVTADGVRTEAAMVDRKVTTLFASMSEVVGMEAQRDIAVGEKADQHDFKPYLVAHRGQVVNVVYVSGSLQIQTSGRAQDDAKLHDRIDVRNDSTGKTYSAVFIARGLGVTGGNLTAEQEKKIIETMQ